MKKSIIYIAATAIIASHTAEKQTQAIVTSFNQDIQKHYDTLAGYIEKNDEKKFRTYCKEILQENSGQFIMSNILDQTSTHAKKLSDLAADAHISYEAFLAEKKQYSFSCLNVFSAGFFCLYTGALAALSPVASVMSSIQGGLSFRAWTDNIIRNHDFYHGSQWAANNCSKLVPPQCTVNTQNCFTDSGVYLGFANVATLTTCTVSVAMHGIKYLLNKQRYIRQQSAAIGISLYIQTLEQSRRKI
ncbi:MAG TPA: hypothetical protein VEK38_01860 [Candidatus Bathyarchaeia archaeon]|nr:hypothetical protein [Candidatus Bathyarchaeia archaeon]